MFRRFYSDIGDESVFRYKLASREKQSIARNSFMGPPPTVVPLVVSIRMGSLISSERNHASYGGLNEGGTLFF